VQRRTIFGLNFSLSLIHKNNDRCMDAFDFGFIATGWSTTHTGQSNIGAGDEGDGLVCDVVIGRGVWYKLNVASPATVTASTTCSPATTFDTGIAIFSGSCDSPVCEAGADDTNGCTMAARLRVDLSAGDIYILVYGSDESMGYFDLEISVDFCPDDDNKLDPGICGCGFPDVDSNGNNQMDCMECGFGVVNTVTQECDCNTQFLGGPGYCRDENGKCTLTKIADSSTNLFYCPGTTPPSETICQSQEMCQELFGDAICLHKPILAAAYCAASDACVHGTYNAATHKCVCEGSGNTAEAGFCIHVDTGACTLPKEVASVDASGTTKYRCPPQVVRHGGGRGKKLNGT